MDIREAHAKAKQLAQAGEYEQALQALIGYDHPKIEALRVQIREAIALKHGKTSATVAQINRNEVAAGIKQAKDAEKQAKAKQQGYGCLAVIVIFFVCWLIVTLTVPPQPQASIQEVCEWQEIFAPSTSCTPERILRDYRPMVDACYAVWYAANDVNIVEWMNCLENKSVDLID